MIPILISGVFEWSDFYKDGSVAEAVLENLNARISTIPNKNHLHIRNSLFDKIDNPSGNGGIISWKSYLSNTKLLIETCSLINCSAKKSGGALHVDGPSYVIAYVCGYGCISLQSRNFADVRVKSSCFIQVNQSSVCCTFSEKAFSISHSTGNQLLDSLNSTANQCLSNTALLMENALSSSIYFSSFVNNTAKNDFVIKFSAATNDYLVKNSNFINNNQKKTTNALFYFGSSATLEKTCFLLNNSPRYVFYIPVGCIITFKQCANDTPINKINIEGERFVNIEATSYINVVKCLNTEKCKASYDSIGDLTAAVIPDDDDEKKVVKTRRFRRSIFIHIIIIVIFICC